MSDIKKLGKSWIFNWFFGFNQIPTNEDSSTYMKSVLCCANADEVLSAEEKDWALGFCASWGVEDWVIEELKTYKADEDLTEVIARSPQVSIAQRDLLLTAIWACAADGELHEKEKIKIRQMASILGVKEEIVEQLEQLQQEESALRQKRLKLLYPEKSPY
ncbi:MAG: TerB family tellurite resistance protein [Nostoc sp. DedVER02]|uniref:TerB family tellurite resistance protein n=1 Tax=unclassified Nostoc TaxID=2593658 RepID=UPI002AD4ED20|nr:MULTISPECIES: TerB family tellurite resistance protein [unclassified Nostoc]MDZ7988525.1 TerB family tellurite resistance protein [Nostoc sp. DedVER02]MDZ8112291.1 TerB family tellurite resistance protein [Nostoc sp. DedVER01b]